MKKISKFLIFLSLLFSGIIFLLYPSITKKIINDLLLLWLNKVLVSLLPFYVLSSILIQYPYISKVLYRIFYKIMRFENRIACSLFFISFITGNPTSSILVINSVKNGEISINEGNRLLRCTVLSSPLFTITMCFPYGWYVLSSQMIVSVLFYILGYRKTIQGTFSNTIHKNSIFDIAEHTPALMLEILSTMLIVGLLKVPFDIILNKLSLNDIIFIKYPMDMIELTTGLANIGDYNVNSSVKLILSANLLSFGGITIIFQIMNQLKKTSLSKTSLVMSRILHGLCTVVILILMILIFKI
ncbi:MAG: hypothetical protein ACI32E_04985 [Bacilli bacterium]